MAFSVTQHPDRILLRQNDVCEVEIFPFGALLNRFEFRLPEGRWHNVVAAFHDSVEAQQHITRGFRSAKLSPFVCRLKDAAYTFAGAQYILDKHLLNGSALHGLFYDAPFNVDSTAADVQGASVVLSYAYHHVYPGYPFDLTIQVRYHLADAGCLRIETEIANIGQESLPLADGWHPYFRLDGDLADWRLRLNSKTAVELDPDLLPTGKLVADSRFSHGAPLGSLKLDDCFIAQDFTEAAVILQSERLKLSLMPEAAYPYIQVYIPPERDSIALENLSAAPDAFNNGMGLRLLAPGQSQTFATTYRVSAVTP